MKPSFCAKIKYNFCISKMSMLFCFTYFEGRSLWCLDTSALAPVHDSACCFCLALEGLKGVDLASHLYSELEIVFVKIGMIYTTAPSSLVNIKA